MTRAETRFAWVLNLDAELELATPGYSAPARVTRQLEAYGAGARALLGPDDVLVEAGTERLEAGAFIGRAWCPTPRALAALVRAGAEAEPHPPASVLREVNHRRFAHELGGGLPGQTYVEERAVLDALLDRKEQPLLLKRPLAFAGRGQLRVYGTPSGADCAWMDASLRADGLVVEPLVVPTLECGLHGFVAVDGTHELGRPTVQEVSDRGVFRAVRAADPGELAESELRELVSTGERVARALAERGYFGPFGIDVYRYELDGRTAFCALGELNARYTMGFVTGFPRHPGRLRLG